MPRPTDSSRPTNSSGLTDASRPAGASGPARMPRLVPVASGDVRHAAGADVLAVPVAAAPQGESEPQPRPGTADAAVWLGLNTSVLAEQQRFRGTAGEVLGVPLPSARDDGAGPRRLVLLGVGDGSATSLRRAGAALARATRGAERVVTTAGTGLPPADLRAFCEGLLLAAYAPPREGVTDGPRPPAELVELLGTDEGPAFSRAVVAARATWRARDLTATPSSTKSPHWVADQARAMAAGVPGVEVEVWDARELRRRGFGGVLAVGAGSATPPCVVTVRYTPPAGTAPRRHVVLVGKGITFDTGGLSIKPREAMVPMKTDMAGAAVVLAAVLGAAELELPQPVTAVLPLAENAVGASSYRPGDVVRVLGGTSVEIANTDAEGRMVLADALVHADTHLAPDLLVDVATLTGAASLGLGKRHAALYTADAPLLEQLRSASAATGERVWRMPLVEDYTYALESDVADLRHVAAKGGPGGGSITAALFLREFTGGRRWAHLDIAGPGRADKDEHEVTKGATGFGARLLLRWLEDGAV
ncbi:leucyl aminopeptidase family protein [Pseudokineococcus sp. 1T1Z-3]|uniref:leucyl aminopeptidase family protein n=1 Tax=Pseudokineococcus sp. 1T1Z-3 TaxID=3132745 RepID=UPI003096F8C6